MATGRGERVGVGLLLASVLLAACPCAFALDPSLDVSQYAHTAWTVREGFSKSGISAISQTPDGYLWLGTLYGLLRFDGVRNVSWQPPPDQHLPSNQIFSLLATPDGTLWIGTWNGLASWKDGKLTNYAQLAGRYIYKILEDKEGTVWASGFSSSPHGGRLCAIRSGSVQCYGEDETLGRGAFNLYQDSKGNLWAGVKTGLWRWRPGSPKFYPLAGEPDGIQALGEDADGTLLVGWKGGIYRFVDGKTEMYPLPGPARQFRANRILRDLDGGLWIGTTSHGLVHVHQGRTDVFAQLDSLSADLVQDLFEDREGNIWVATINGLDRFRDFAVATMTAKQGLSNAVVVSVLADRDGGTWLSTPGGVDRWNSGQIKTYRLGTKPNDLPESLFQDDRGRVWLSSPREFGYLENGQFNSVGPVPGGEVLSIAQDRAGNLWVANEHLGLFRLSPRSEVRQIPWTGLGRQDHASVLAADASQSGLWIGFFLGGIAYFEDGQIRSSYSAADGLGEGRVGGFLFDHGGTLWASTAGGLSRLKSGRIATLTSKNGLPCDTVNWVMEDNDHSFWLYTACGLVRIDRSEVDAWTTAVDQNKDTKRTIHVTVFDSSDGVRSLASGAHFNPQVARSSDGRIWFLPWDGVSVVNPRHIPFNKLPPPVHIEQITADHETYDATSAANGNVNLPPRIRDLQIDYTALSLVAPEKVLFRYKLEGWDRDWHDAGNRRQAFYSNLPPRKYTFRVMACNNSGVWNEAGAALDFSVAPAYYQTWWFRLTCVAAFLGLLAALHQWRLRQAARQFNIRLEGRVSERTRIARELHDTLLQSFQGVLLKLHGVTFMIRNRPVQAEETLEKIVDEAQKAVSEGRDAIQGMRSSTVITNDLAQTISMLGAKLADDHTDGNRPEFRVLVEGQSRDLPPILRDDIYRIVSEALRNAFRHSHASRIEVEIHYDQLHLRLRVRDNGKGIDPKVLDARGRVGHYGMPGMGERAELVGGKLTVWSEINSGTEIELKIPARVAYAKSPASRRPKFWRKGA